MKNTTYKCIALFLCLSIAISCSDDSLDPLNQSQLKKGTMLALRGTQLQNIYNDGFPGAELFPKIATGNEVFAFDAEFLSENPTSLVSFDVFAIKKISATQNERVLLLNVPVSEFVTTDDYLRPWVSVSIPVVDIMQAIGLSGVFPLSTPEVTTLLTTYAFGIPIESDLHLTDGSSVLASDIRAAGFFQSNQFYPAQKLNYAMTDYCSFDNSLWSGGYVSTETGVNPVYGYGPYVNGLTQDGTDPNKFYMDNFWDCGYPDYFIVLTPSTDPSTQIIAIPEQTTANGTITGLGTYNQCLQSLTFTITYASSGGSCGGGATYVFRYGFVR